MYKRNRFEIPTNSKVLKRYDRIEDNNRGEQTHALQRDIRASSLSLSLPLSLFLSRAGRECLETFEPSKDFGGGHNSGARSTRRRGRRCVRVSRNERQGAAREG